MLLYGRRQHNIVKKLSSSSNSILKEKTDMDLKALIRMQLDLSKCLIPCLKQTDLKLIEEKPNCYEE